jgi:cullin-associated NEDD8-dissociated protein 1
MESDVGLGSDMSNQTDVFNNALGFFKSDSEEVRSAAAFAVGASFGFRVVNREADIMVVGNIAIGSQDRFLPVIIKQVQSDDEKRLLSMHALKEVCPKTRTPRIYSLLSSGRLPLLAC